MDLNSAFKKLSPSVYRLRILVSIIAVLVLPFAIYYLFYVRSQCDYFTDRSFRKLATISSQIGSRVESVALVFKNNSDRFIRPYAKDSLTFDPNPAAKHKNFENLKEVFKRLKGDRQIVPISIDTEPWRDKVLTGTVTLSSVRHEGDSSWLYLDYVSDGLRAKTIIRVRAKTDLNKQIQSILSARVGSDYNQFQNILITESETARVIFQHDTTEVRLASLDKLSSSDDQAKKADLKEISQTSNVIDVSLAGSDYRLFSHPLKVSLPSNNADSPNITWIMSGLIKSNSFQTEAWSISVSYTILIIGGFLVALLIFSWPFLKLVLAGPKDRFKPRDVYFLIFSSIAILAVITCFVLYGYVYTSVEAEMDRQVRELASKIKTNFNEELKKALVQLDTLSQNGEIIKQLKLEKEKRKSEGRAGASGQPGSQPKPRSNAAHAVRGPDIYQQGETNKTNILPAILASPRTTYNYFDSAAWIDETSMQKAKWSVKSYNTQYVPVSDREYFKNIRKSRFRELDGREFWLQPLISKNTGRNQVEVSMASIHEPWIVAADVRLLSLMDPVLPVGYGYAIIEADGKVLFHSDEAQHVGENLFQECDEDLAVNSALVARNDKALNVRYLGEDHHFFITTLKGFPDWSLVVFRNKQPLRGVFFELLTSVAVLFLIYGLVLMVGFTGFYIFNVVNQRRAWLWPSEKKTAVYVQSILLLLVLSVVSLALTIVLHGENLVWLIAGIGLFGGFAYFVNLRWGLSSPLLKHASSLLNQFNRYDRLYVVNASLLLLLVAILPAGSFFKYAYESQMGLFIKHAQYSLATALAKRDERIRKQYSNIRFTEDAGTNETELEKKKREAFIHGRLTESWDVYDNFFFQTNRENTEPEQASCTEASQTDRLTRLSTVLPVSNCTSIERRGLLDSTFVGGVGKWESAAMGSLIFHLEGKAGPPASHLSTSVPLLGIPGFASIAILALFFPLSLFVRYMVRKVFLLDVRKPTSHSLKTFLSEKIDRNVFVVANTPFIEKARCNGSNLELKALPGIATSSNWADTFDYDSGGPGTVIALDQFEYGMDDPQMNQQKLKLMENLLEKQRTLLIFSTAEFSKYRFSNEENGHVNGEEDEVARRAGVVISDFFTEYAEDTDDGSSFQKRVAQEKARLLAQGVNGRSTKEIDELIETLCVECAPREPLQRIGLKLLSLKEFITLSREQLIARIVDQSRAYYSHIWSSCSSRQRQTLCHLAQDRLLSHRDPDIEPLLRRELIVRENDFHLFNESFRQFVKSADRVSFVVEQDKQTQQGSLWQTLKVPILIGMLAITAFLFLTQQDLYSRSLALLTGITTLIPALFKVLAMFHADPVTRSQT